MLIRYYNIVIIFIRGQNMEKRKKSAFTLVELLVTILIIGVLAGLLYLAIRPSGDMAREKACSGNRATVLLALDSYRFSSGVSKETYTLQNFIDDDYKDTISNKEVKCPSGGTYSAGTSNGREAVVCSVHGGGDEPGGGDGPGPSGNVIPGTDLFGGDGYQAIDDWEEAIISENSISFSQGEKFKYEDKYYVAVGTESDIYYNGNSSPEMENVETKWWTTKSGGGLVEFTGVSKNWDEIETGYRFYRGDILYYNGDYYVCMVQGYTGYYDIVKGQWWSNTPDLPPDLPGHGIS